MVRDLNLMRQIMLDLEKYPEPMTSLSALYPNETDENAANIKLWHLKLLEDAGYIKLGDITIGCYPDCQIDMITNDGYEFIRLTKEESIWKKLYPLFLKGGGIASTTVIQKLVEKLLAP